MPIPVVTATINITLSPAVIQDINTHWLSQTNAQLGSLQTAMAAGDPSFTLAGSSNSTAQFGVGSTLLIDNEPVQVTAINGNTYTVSRYLTAFPFMADLLTQPATAHAAGTPVMLIQWPDPWTLIAQEALRPWAQQVTINLGAKSATFGAVASGSMSVSAGS